MSKLRSYSPWVLLVALVAGILSVLFFVTPILPVGSGSMEPVLPVGSRVIIHEEASYHVGDIITFSADEGKQVTHRLVKFGDNDELITKGDANPTPDAWNDPVTLSDVRGKVIFMTPITTLDFWMTFRGIGIILLLLLITAALYFPKKEEEEEVDTSETEAKVS